MRIRAARPLAGANAFHRKQEVRSLAELGQNRAMRRRLAAEDRKALRRPSEPATGTEAARP